MLPLVWCAVRCTHCMDTQNRSLINGRRARTAQIVLQNKSTEHSTWHLIQLLKNLIALHKITQSHEINSKHINHNCRFALHSKFDSMFVASGAGCAMATTVHSAHCTPKILFDLMFAVWALCYWRFNMNRFHIALSKYSSFISILNAIHSAELRALSGEHRAIIIMVTKQSVCSCLFLFFSFPVWKFKINWLSQKIHTKVRPSKRVL